MCERACVRACARDPPLACGEVRFLTVSDLRELVCAFALRIASSSIALIFSDFVMLLIMVGF